MGYYVNSTSAGVINVSDFDSKIKAIMNDGAIPTTPDKFKENMVCIVDNGHFAAIGYVYSEREFEAFKESDGRPKRWFIYEQAPFLSGYKKP